MNIENPTSIISSATNAIAQITSLAAEKLGPVTTKTVEVVSRQVVVEAVTLAIATVVLGIVCLFATKLTTHFNAKITGSSSAHDDSINGPFSLTCGVVAVLSGIAFIVTLIIAIIDVPTAIFNTEYATAQKFVEIFQTLKP